MRLGKKTSSRFKDLRVTLREKLSKREFILAPGSHSPLFAKLVEKAGFDCVYMTGSGTSASILGMADVGLTTMTEMVGNVKNICRAVNIPVIADMDTGFGNAINVMRSASEYELAGVSGYHIEDQITPKKCGFMKGKMVISTEEMVGKIKACVEARDDENLIIIARTDARAMEGNKAMWERANTYLEAGADVLFAEAPRSSEDIKGDLKNIKGPLLLNGINPVYGFTKIVEAEKAGFAIVILAWGALRPALKASYDFLVEVKKTGTYPREPMELSTVEITELAQVRMYEEKFLPSEELLKRYKSRKVPREF